MFGVVERLCLVDQHDRDVIHDRVPETQPWVIEALFGLEVEKRALVTRASQDLEQLWCECHPLNLPDHVASNLGHAAIDFGIVGGFEI